MDYRYFTLEQRAHLEQAMREAAATPTELERALERLHSPALGNCEACGSEMPYVAMIEAPVATLCPACRSRTS